MYDEPKRYENDNLYDEDTDYYDEYDTDAPDYIDEDEEDENALWDDEEDTTDEADPNESPRKKRREQVTFSSIEDEEAEEQEQAQRRLAKEQRLIDELEADAEEHPIEDDGDDTGDEQPERKLLKRELRAQALKRLEDSARTLKDY